MSEFTNTNAGWNKADEWLLDRQQDNEPELQIFDEGNWEVEDKELREYFCAICKGKLDYLKNMDMWYCSACVQYYDTHIQDVPLKNIKDSRVKTYPELDKYPTFEDNDIHMPFVQGISPDEYDSVPGNVEVLRDDGRVKHVRVKGNITEALATMNEMDGRY